MGCRPKAAMKIFNEVIKGIKGILNLIDLISYCRNEAYNIWIEIIDRAHIEKKGRGNRGSN